MIIHKEEVGIAVLSTDRPHCLKRFLQSIQDHSNMHGLYVMVMDDSSDPDATQKVADEFPFTVFFHKGERLGIAKNTNLALLGLTQFPYKILFNNDVEIIRDGWIYYYPLAMHQTGIHHFCFQQEGLWGAGTDKRPQEFQYIGERKIKTIHNFPQGAIMAFDQEAFRTVGYYDEETFKGYGKSHWDWSFRVSESGIQPKGIHDVVGSNDYFKVHNEACSTPQNQRVEDYKRNTELFNQLRGDSKRIFIDYA